MICHHNCNSECRRTGCNCECGEFHDNTLKEVRAKVREAIGVPPGTIVYGRPIQLHDVLRAIGSEYRNSATDIGGFTRDLLNTGWNLALPLDDQEPKVIKLVHKLLHL
jgi:hypothetical protein